MPKTLLFIRPSDDQAAQLSSQIGGRLVRWIRHGGYNAQGYQVTDLAGSANTTKKGIDAELKKSPDHLLYFGVFRPSQSASIIGIGLASGIVISSTHPK